MKLARRASYVLLGVFGLLAVAMLALHTPSARRYVLGKIQSILQANGIDLDASSLTYNLLSTSVEFRDLHIAADRPGAPPLFEADRVYVRVAMIPLFRGIIRITDGLADRPVLRIVTNAAGISNMPGGGNTSTEEPASQTAQNVTSYFQVGDFEIKDAALTVRNDPAQTDVRLPLWQATIGDKGTATTHIQIETKQAGEAVVSGRLIPIESLLIRAGVDFSGQTLTVETARIESAGSEVVVEGNAANLRSPHVSVRTDARLALSRIMELAVVEKSASGEMKIHIDAEGPFEAIQAKFQLTGSSEKMTFGEFEASRLSANGTYDGAAGQLVLESLDLGLGAGTIEAQGTLALAEGESTMRARISNVDLEELARAIGSNFLIASRATGTVSASWPGVEFRRADGKALLRFAKIRPRPQEGRLPLAGDVEALISKGQITLFLGQRPSTAGKRSTVPIRPVSVPDSSWRRIQGAIRPVAVNGAAYHSNAESRPMLALASAGAPDNSFPTVSAWLRRFALGSLSAQQANPDIVPSIQLNALDALASILTGQVSVTPNGELSGRLSAHVRDIGELLSDLNMLTGGAVPAKAALKGEADVLANISGDFEAPVIDIQTTARSVQVGRLQDVSAHISAVYSPERLTIRTALIQQQNQIMEAHGVVALGADGPMDFETRVSDLQVATVLDSIGRADLPISGMVSLEGNVMGTLQQPQGTVRAAVSDLKAYGEPWGSMDLDAKIADQHVELRRFELKKTIIENSRDSKDAGTLTATGDYDLQSQAYTLDLKASDLRLHQLAANGHAVSGVLNATAKGQGTLNRPMFATELYVSDLLFDTQDPKKQLSGNLKANIDVAGDRHALRDLTVELRADEIKLSGDGFDLHTIDPIRARYKDRVLNVNNATLAVNDGRMTIAGSLPIDSSATAAGIRLTAALDLRSGYRLVPFLEKSRAMGMLDVDLQIRGSLNQPAPDGIVTLQQASLDNPSLLSPVEQLQVTMRLTDRQIVLEQASAAWAGASITAQGAAPLAVLIPSMAGAQTPADAVAELNVDVTSIQLASILKRSGDTEVGGTISLHLDARAPRLEPDAMTANLRFDELNADIGGIQIEQQGKSSISLAEGTLKIDQFQLTGPETKIEAAGTAQLIGDKAVEVRLVANTNASLASVFFENGQVEGLTNIELMANGTLSSPNIHGFAAVKDGQFAIETPNVAATNLNLRVDFTGNHFEFREASGTLNGGQLKIAGGGSLGSGVLQDIDVTVTGDDVYMNFPEGLLTVSDLDLAIRSRDELLVVGGRASVQDGTFRRNINVQAGVINLLQSGNTRVNISSDRSEFLSRLRYNLTLETPTAPIFIDNNLGQFAVLSSVRLVGGYYTPSLTGRVQLDGAGELYLNGNTFYIERGVATFVSEQQIRPEVDILAHAKVSGYDVTMSVTGPAGRITTTLTSDPPLPESDIVSVLLVGRPLKDIRGAEAEVASQQLLSYVAGGLGSALSSQLQEVFGLSQVRIEPVLVAGETTPDARLTIGQNLASNLNLTYSRSMTDGDDIWIGEYDAMRSLVGKITKQSDNSYRFDLNNDWQFGGTPLLMKGSMREKKTISAIHFTGMTSLSEEDLQGKLKVKTGDEFDFFKLRKGATRIQETLHDRHRLEAQVRLGTASQNAHAEVNVNVEAGPTVTFSYEGWHPHGALEGQVRDIWRKGIFDAQRANQAEDALQEQLAREGFLLARVDHRIESLGASEKHVIFNVAAGPRFEKATLIFPGAESIPVKELSDVLSDAGVRDRLLIEPSKARSLIERYYADRGYLGAQVELPRVEANTGTGSITIRIDEGPLYHFGPIVAEGNQAYSDQEIATRAEVAEGTTYTPEVLDTAVSQVQKLYTDHGYNEAIVNYELQTNDTLATVQLLFQIEEGKQQVLRQLIIEGNRETTPNMIQGQVRVKPGEILTTPAISRARSSLYQTGAYQLIELTRSVVTDEPSFMTLAPNQVPVDLRVIVHEIQPYRILAGGYYDTDRGPGAIIDISNRNSLGSAKVLGLRSRYDADLQETRLYFSQPFLRRFPVRSLGETYWSREVKEAFVSDRVGVSFGQEASLGNRYILNYGYRLERARVFNLTDQPLTSTTDTTESGGATDGNGIISDANPVPAFGQVTARLAPLTTTISRDTRDDVLNATRGQFVSHGFAISFSFFGSQQQYMKYFAQYFRFIPLSKPEPIPFKPNLKKPRFSYAGGVRFGLGRGLNGQALIPSEKFFAGGGTTIRGFKQDQVGPTTPAGVPVGGNALLIINNEVRMPVWSLVGAVAFLDLGNVYPRIQDFNPLRIRAAAGIGLRLNTPWVLVRGDYGVKLGRHPGESLGAFFVSIGQAF